MSDKWKKKDKNVQNCEVKEEVNSQEILEEDEKCDRGGESHAEEKVDESPAVEEERCCRCCCCDSDDDDDDDDDWDDDDWGDDDDDDDGECPYCGRAWKSTCLHHHDHYYHGRCCGDCDCDCDCDCECGCRGHYTKNTCRDMAMAVGKTIALSAIATATTMLVTAVLRRVIR